MPDTIAIAQIYSFSNLLERALQDVFTASNVKSFTSQYVPMTGDPVQDAALVAAGFELLDFQRARPRAEISFALGAGQKRWRPLLVAGARVPVESAWKGNFSISAITKADIREHNDFVVTLRFILQTCRVRLNNTATMTRHAVAPFSQDTGSSHVTSPETGVFQTTLTQEIDLSVQDNAWAILET